MRMIFITATGTDMGKTLITCAYCNQLIARGYRVKAIKPVVSGWNDQHNDTKLIIEALGQNQDIEAISPWRFNEAVSPFWAAKKIGHNLPLQQIVDFCLNITDDCDIMLIEGAGGLMSPLATDNFTNLDLITALGAEALLVAGSYLGSISHTLTAIEALKTRRVPIHSIIINDNQTIFSRTDITDTTNQLKDFTEHQIRVLPYIQSQDFRHVPTLYI